MSEGANSYLERIADWARDSIAALRWPDGTVITCEYRKTLEQAVARNAGALLLAITVFRPEVRADELGNLSLTLPIMCESTKVSPLNDYEAAERVAFLLNEATPCEEDGELPILYNLQLRLSSLQEGRDNQSEVRFTSTFGVNKNVYIKTFTKE